jgi:hypothetical protein
VATRDGRGAAADGAGTAHLRGDRDGVHVSLHFGAQGARAAAGSLGGEVGFGQRDLDATPGTGLHRADATMLGMDRP